MCFAREQAVGYWYEGVVGVGVLGTVEGEGESGGVGGVVIVGTITACSRRCGVVAR